MTIADFRHFGSGSSGRRPLLIALMIYSLGFTGAGLLVWGSAAGAGGAQSVDHYLCW